MTDAFERAAKRELVDYQKLGFRVHLFVYVAVQALLIATWAITSRGEEGSFPWFLFPLFGWGIGLAAHYAVYSVISRARRAEAAYDAEARTRRDD